MTATEKKAEALTPRKFFDLSPTGELASNFSENDLIRFASACVEEALQPMRKYLLLVYRQKRGGGAGGQMISYYKCMACGDDEVAASTAHGWLCRQCDEELRTILRATKAEG